METIIDKDRHNEAIGVLKPGQVITFTQLHWDIDFSVSPYKHTSTVETVTKTISEVKEWCKVSPRGYKTYAEVPKTYYFVAGGTNYWSERIIDIIEVKDNA